MRNISRLIISTLAILSNPKPITAQNTSTHECKQAENVWIIRIIILSNVILQSQFRNSQSLLKNPGGGQDKPAGISCPPPIIEGILSD